MKYSTRFLQNFVYGKQNKRCMKWIFSQWGYFFTCNDFKIL